MEYVMKPELSRRRFLQLSAGAVGVSSLGRRSLADVVAAAQTAAKLEQFPYGDVQLLEGPMQTQFNANHAYFLGLDEDALLKPFRQRAGLPSPGPDMGG